MRIRIQLFAVLLALAVSTAVRAQSYVQGAFKDTGISGSVAAAFPKETTPGNTYVVFVTVDLRHGDLMRTGPADTEGNKFRQVLVTTSPNRTTKQYVFDCIGVVGGTKDSIRLAATTGINVGILELHDAKYLDQKAQQGGTTTSAVTPPVTTTQDAEIILGVMSGNPSAPFPGFGNPESGWIRTPIGGGTQHAQYRTVNSAQADVAAAANVNQGGTPPNTDWLAGILTYSASAATDASDRNRDGR